MGNSNLSTNKIIDIILVIVTRRRLVPQLTQFYSKTGAQITNDNITVVVPKVSSDSLATISNDSGSISTEDILTQTRQDNSFISHINVCQLCM